MKHSNSTTYINYKDQTNSSKGTNVVFTSAKSDSISTIIKNKTFVSRQDLYVQVDIPIKTPSK